MFRGNARFLKSKNLVRPPSRHSTSAAKSITIPPKALVLMARVPTMAEELKRRLDKSIRWTPKPAGSTWVAFLPKTAPMDVPMPPCSTELFGALPQGQQQVFALDRVVEGNMDLIDHPVYRGGDGGLHFHGFQHQEFVAFTDLVANAYRN